MLADVSRPRPVSRLTHGFPYAPRPSIVGRMTAPFSPLDPILAALIESEAALDAHYANVPPDELAPVARIADGEGAELLVYGDGSYVCMREGMPLAPGAP